jgi:hypothetical protein
VCSHVTFSRSAPLFETLQNTRSLSGQHATEPQRDSTSFTILALPVAGESRPR